MLRVPERVVGLAFPALAPAPKRQLSVVPFACLAKPFGEANSFEHPGESGLLRIRVVDEGAMNLGVSV